MRTESMVGLVCMVLVTALVWGCDTGDGGADPGAGDATPDVLDVAGDERDGQALELPGDSGPDIDDVPSLPDADDGDAVAAPDDSQGPDDAEDSAEAGGDVPECTGSEQCPATDNPCMQRACEDGRCTQVPLSEGTILEAQVPGDCLEQQCDGDGSEVSVAADEDLPDDRNPCTLDLCQDGVPGHDDVLAGEPCGDGLMCDGAGACVECGTSEDCPGVDDECGYRTCTDHVCGFVPEEADKPLEAQTPGDCRLATCDGTGGTGFSVADDDLPVDGNECTMDVCTAGTPSNPPLSAGTACSEGGNQCDGDGNCVECLVASECGPDTPCRQFLCNDGICGVADTPADIVVGDPVVGDCRSVECDGNGNVIADAIFDDDLPLDQNECTVDVCSAGVPSNPPADAGTACSQNGGSQCDGEGNCVECLLPSDCGTNTPCMQFLCFDGICGANVAPPGAMVSDPVAGDCRSAQCDGNGNVIPDAAYDDDLPVDGKECTMDVCTAGVPSNPPMSAGTPCSEKGGTQCDGDGNCVECLVAADCGTSTACKVFGCNAGICGVYYPSAGTIVSNPAVGDCRTDQCDGEGNLVANVVDNGDLPLDGAECTYDVCTAGVPSNPPAGAGTPCSQNGGNRCDGNGKCVECIAGSDCGTSTPCMQLFCFNGFCAANFPPQGSPVDDPVDGDCQSAVCNGYGGVVASIDDSDVPVDGNACTLDVCTAGVPSNPPASFGTSCAQDGGTRCDGDGHCVQCAVAQDCGVDSPCMQFVCINGTCGANYSAPGTVLFDPVAGDCRSFQCDGNGGMIPDAPDDSDLPEDGNQCTLAVCTAGSPSTPPEPAGTVCAQNGGTRCDGEGNCVQCLVTSDCDNPLMDCSKDHACVYQYCMDTLLNGDESDTDCGGSCPPCVSGQHCVFPSDCLSGSCKDGVCG